MAAGKGSAGRKRRPAAAPAAAAAATEEGDDLNRLEEVEEQAEQPSTAPRAKDAKAVEEEAEEAEDVIPLEGGASQPMQTSSKKKKKRRASVGNAVDDSNVNTSTGEEKPRVVYVGHIPHGFFEKEMKGFFSQFGTVTRLRLSRNKQTAKSKGYAFVEFDSPAVAAIAAGAMDNYLMFGQMLQCKLVPPERLHARTFVGANRKFARLPWQKWARETHNKERTVAETEKQVDKLLQKDEERRQKIAAAGIDYQFDGYAGSMPNARPKRKVFAADEDT